MKTIYIEDVVIKQWKQLAAKMSYYNAAEGRQYGQEANKRMQCRQALIDKTRELENEYGVDVSQIVQDSDYLLSTYDWR